MKRFVSIFSLLLFAAVLVFASNGQRRKMTVYNSLTKTWSSYPVVPIDSIQYVSNADLHLCDSLQEDADALSPHWDLQSSRFGKWGVAPYASVQPETIITYGVVICPAHVITYTATGWTMQLHTCDTNTHTLRSNVWGGILVREGADTIRDEHGNITQTFGVDSAQARLDDFEVPQEGDIVYMTGIVSEFASSRMISTTQFAPIYGIKVTRSGSIPITQNTTPSPTLVGVTTFNTGTYNSRNKHFTTGEQYEGAIVELTGLTVVSYLNGGRQIMMVDGSGNQITDYDISWYWTAGNAGGSGDPSFHEPPLGAVIDTIRGVIQNTSGQEIVDGYRICPLYPGDIIYGVAPPYLSAARRYPVVVNDYGSVSVQVSVNQIPGAYPLYYGGAVLLRSINGQHWAVDTMTLSKTLTSVAGMDSLVFTDNILDYDNENPLPAGSDVRYFFKALDVRGNEGILANSSGTYGRDTSLGFFSYHVFNGSMTIHDVQYTPYPNGNSLYNAGITTLAGIVTADSIVMRLTPYTTSVSGIGTNCWYIQNGAAPWNGIWVTYDSTQPGALAQLGLFRLGDSVEVTGRISENYNVTTLFDSIATVISPNHPLPAPALITTHDLGRSNGDSLMERWEGMLVRVLNTQVADTIPYYADPTEYTVDDGSGGARVRRDGWENYSTQPGDTAQSCQILHVGDRVDTLTGVVYYSYGMYKIVPRTNADFAGVGYPYTYQRGWNIVSVGRTQLPQATGYGKSHLFPSSVSPAAFAYQPGHGYVTTTNMVPDAGYWLKFGATSTIRQLGLKRTADTIRLGRGWNLVGTLGETVTTVTPGPGVSLGAFFGYSAGYTTTTTLVPSKGYWVKSNADGYMVLGSSHFSKLNPAAADLAEFNTLAITDKDGNSQTLYFGQDATGKFPVESFEMPPPGPAGTMRAEFASGRVLEAYPSVLVNPIEYAISINAAQAPLKIKWNIVAQNGRRIVISDGANGTIFKPVTVAGSGEVTIGKSVAKMMLSVGSGSAIPKEFALSQNYPNPFNPTTQFAVSIPQTSHLQVAVFDLLGQKVATLADDDRPAGYYTIQWRGTNDHGASVASGVYFVRMNAVPSTSSGQVPSTSSGNPFTSLKKMVLLK